MGANANDKQDKSQGSGGTKQQQGSGGQQQQQSGAGQQYGEGNYKATRDYNAGLKDHVEHHDIEKEARDAAPKSDEEAREMEAAEREGRSRAKGESEPRDDPDDPESEQNAVK